MKILIIGKTWPEPASTAAGVRTMGLVEACLDAGWEVTFASGAVSCDYSVDLNALGVSQQTIAVNDSAFDLWIQQLSPDLVIFDRYMMEEQFGWRVEKACPEALRILDSSDLHCLRMARQRQVKSGEPLNLFNETALREIAAIYRSDLTLMISEYEIGLLREHFGVPDSLLFYLPLMAGEPLESVPSFEERTHFVMIGSYLHEPNWDAVRWCSTEIWPLVRDKLPDAELHLYGSYEPDKARALANADRGIQFQGRATDALETLKHYRVNLAPLRFGAGQKGKVVDAWLAGTPTVATPVAAESMHGAYDWGCRISDDPSVFAQTALALYHDEMPWNQVQDCGYKILGNRFRSRVWKPLFIEALRSLTVESRKYNFIGQILRHHHHRSTEYMSRWIEAKNALGSQAGA